MVDQILVVDLLEDRQVDLIRQQQIIQSPCNFVQHLDGQLGSLERQVNVRSRFEVSFGSGAVKYGDIGIARICLISASLSPYIVSNLHQ